MLHELSSEPWDHVNERVLRKVAHGARMSVTRYSFAPGGRFPRHTHLQEQITYVLSGRLTFEVDGARHELLAGDVIIIPADVVHAAEADEDTEVVSVVSPSRRDEAGVTYVDPS